MDKICSNETGSKPLYYCQLKNYKKKIPEKILKKTKNNLEVILTTIIKNSLIEIYPLDIWKN